jgi:glycosyltransferase involved in cell wall biosynthesis
VSDLPAYREWVVQGENGLLVPPKDEEALVAAMSDLLCDPDKRRSWGARNRSLAQQRADRDTEMERLMSLYLNLKSCCG